MGMEVTPLNSTLMGVYALRFIFLLAKLLIQPHPTHIRSHNQGHVFEHIGHRENMDTEEANPIEVKF